MSLRVVAIPSQGTVGSRPRKEPVFDTERLTGNVAPPTSVELFTNFAAFANPVGAAGGGFSGAGTLTKSFARDTNIAGQQGLPAAHHHYWYALRTKVRTMEADLSTADAATVPEALNRYRELTALIFRFTSSELLNIQLDECPNGTGPQFITTTHSGVTQFSLPSGVPTRANAKDVTISGRPIEIVALESFRVELRTPQPGVDPILGVAFTLPTDFYVSVILEGMLLRGITG